jgi:glycosyltransferase involved in cell wall biosynthesis
MNPRSKIVWCVDSPGWGGSEINLLRVWEILNRRSDEVVFNQITAPQLLAVSAAREFTILRQSTPNAASWFLIGMVKALWLVLHHWRREFVIWAHHSDSNRWLQVLLAILRRNFIVIEQLVPASEVDFARSRLSIPLKRFVAQHARYLVLNAYSQEQHYRRVFNVPRARILIIPNCRPIVEARQGTDILRLDKGALRTKLGLPEGRVIACVGRLCPQKDQTTLINAFASLISDYMQSTSLVLLGEGEACEMLQQHAAKVAPGNVIFAGHQPDLWPWLAVADVFVLPSLSEGLPGALIEAMAAGLPCVTTDIPGNRELVINGESGLLVPPQDPVALAAALRLMLENPAEAQRMAEAGHIHVLENYDQATETLLWQSLLKIGSGYLNPN